MINPQIATANKAIGLWKTIKIILIIFFLLLLFAKPISILYDTHDVNIAIFELGRSFFLVSEELNNQSLDIINQGDIYNFDNGFWSGFKHIFLVYAELLSTLGILIVWLNLMYKSISFLTVTSSGMFVLFMTLVVFYFMQVAFILGYNGYEGNITGVMGENSVSYYMSMPITSLINFVKSIPILLYPIKRAGDIALGATNNTLPI